MCCQLKRFTLLILLLLFLIVNVNGGKDKGKGKVHEKGIEKVKKAKSVAKGKEKFCLNYCGCKRDEEEPAPEETKEEVSLNATEETVDNRLPEEFTGVSSISPETDEFKVSHKSEEMSGDANVEESSGSNATEEEVTGAPSKGKAGKGKQKGNKKPKEKKKAKEKVKLTPKGQKVAEKKKINKKPQPANPNVLKWKGKTVVAAGTTANDPPEKVDSLPKQVRGKTTDKSAFGNTCKAAKKKPKRIGRTTTPATTIAPTTSPMLSDDNMTIIDTGPAAQNINGSEFEQCDERKRAGIPKQKVAKNAKQSKSRRKRSESYAAVNWLWKDPENIPVVFDLSFPETAKSVARNAMNMWQNYTCVRFVEMQSPPTANNPYILITSGGGTCTTDRLGPNAYPPYTTVIDASLCLNNTGSLSHEFGHTIGLAHSQKRVDRDSYLNYFPDNVADAWRSQFDKDSIVYFTDWGVPFYYDSIMQYFPYAATVNTLMTLCPLDPLMEVLMGQREEPAFGDLSLINRMYCQESCFNKSDLTKPFDGELSMTISGRTCQNWNSQTPHAHKFTNMGNHSYCRNPDGWNGGPWCYTNEATVVLEPCFSACEDLAAAGRPFCEGWCYHGGYHDPDTCDCVCPRHGSGKFCEIINQSKKYGHLTCGGKISVQENHIYGISSPNWPQNYTNGEVCMWWLEAPVGMKIKLTFSDFAVEIADESGCYDYLEIRKDLCALAKTQPNDMRFCGDSLSPDEAAGPRNVVSDNNNMVLKFVSDDHDNDRGFSLVATAIPS